jgi:hypothetical protein
LDGRIPKMFSITEMLLVAFNIRISTMLCQLTNLINIRQRVKIICSNKIHVSQCDKRGFLKVVNLQSTDEMISLDEKNKKGKAEKVESAHIF